MRKRLVVRIGGLLLAGVVIASNAFAQRPVRRTPSRRTKQAQRATTQQQTNQTPKPAQGSPATPQVPPPVPSDEVNCTLPSCTAFNRLIQAKDRTLTLNLYVPHAYACFDPQTDRFLVVGYSVSVVAIPGNGDEVSDGWVSSDQYENGADVDSDMALGEWHAADSNPGLRDFRETSSSDNDSAFHVAASDSLFTFSRTYQTIQGNAVSIDLRISLPSLQFSESYSAGGQAPTNTSGQCSRYGLASPTPAPFASSSTQ
ncbi:MAG TPA: hypothetical protein VGS59_05695 [Candidatus Acidoferrales bacterium]|nr:hypothetical protein [Candidatus Acidoferrales bacterium]